MSDALQSALDPSPHPQICAGEVHVTGTRESIASPRRNLSYSTPYGRGGGVGRGLGVGVDLGAAVAVGVAVAVAVGVGVGLAPQGLNEQWKISMSPAGVAGS